MFNISSSLSNFLSRAKEVKSERIRFIYSGARLALITNLVISSLTVWLLWDRVSHDSLYSWLSAMLILTIIRGFYVYKFNSSDVKDENIDVWYVLFIVKSTISALLWGITIWVFAPYNDLVTPLLLVLVASGLTAGAAAVLGAVYSVFFLYLIGIIVPMLLWFYLQSGSLYFIVTVILVVYVIAMLFAGYLYRGILIRSVNLSHDLLISKNNAEKANQAKSEFLSSMSHELRTPLNAILGFAQLLKMDSTKPEGSEERESIDYIIRSGQHLLSLINSVLDLSKIEAGQFSIDIDDVSLQAMVDECIPMIDYAASQRKITLNVEGEFDFIVRADAMKLKQIILNLLTNAIKYNKEQGLVTINCSKEADQFVHLNVTDTGSGISEQHQTKLFIPFERLDKENSIIEGTGIGLVISKKYIEAMGGEIGFKSEVGKGSTFWLKLPLKA